MPLAERSIGEGAAIILAPAKPKSPGLKRAFISNEPSLSKLMKAVGPFAVLRSIPSKFIPCPSRPFSPVGPSTLPNPELSEGAGVDAEPCKNPNGPLRD